MTRTLACFVSTATANGVEYPGLTHETVKVSTPKCIYLLCACGAYDENGYHGSRHKQVTEELSQDSATAYLMHVSV